MHETNLTLTKALDICRAADACATQLKELEKLTDSSGHGLAVVECQFCGRGHARRKEVCPSVGESVVLNATNSIIFAVKRRQKLTMSGGEAVH